MRQYAKGVEAEERGVGVGGQAVDKVDDAAAAHFVEHEDAGEEEGYDANMNEAALARLLGLVRFLALQLEEVHTDARGQRGQGRVGAGEGGGNQANAERYRHPRAQHARGDDRGQEFVAAAGDGQALGHTDAVEQDAEAEQEEIDGNEAQAVGAHIALCFAEGAAGEVLLHHVLVEARHDDDDEHAA